MNYMAKRIVQRSLLIRLLDRLKKLSQPSIMKISCKFLFDYQRVIYARKSIRIILGASIAKFKYKYFIFPGPYSLPNRIYNCCEFLGHN